ncbi:hypothetical protein [Streptomyces sp. MMBL 11-3]|uniref:hypothetical protein n=1 Tax=Streptomyces sp. MMBL 11-3 TaxID=3382639 RepID=UPI0039B62ACA
MSDTTRSAAEAAARLTKSTPVGYGFCAWHKEFTRGVRLVHVEEAGSGPNTAGSKFACTPCREKYGLIQFADRPM